jgi:hypothetical protein
VDDFPRRRRLQPKEPKKGGGGIPIFPLIVLVVFAGLLLGGALAKFFGRGAPVSTPAPTFTPLPYAEPTPTFAPRATPHRIASPSASTSPSPTPTASATPSASKPGTPSASPAATATPTAHPSVIYLTSAPKPSPAKSAAPKTSSPIPTVAATSTPVLTTGSATADRASSIVRAYLAAVLRGDESTATGYLAKGLPNESFFTTGAKITDVETTHNADGTYTVAVDISAPSGEYYETFKLAEGPGGLGLQIVDHYAIKVSG